MLKIYFVTCGIAMLPGVGKVAKKPLTVVVSILKTRELKEKTFQTALIKGPN